MSRSSLIYGTFSVVWGFGAALLTVMLAGLADRPDRVIFLAGALLGGFYEYMCSVFTELVFGTVFWDYSDMPLNIGGRTNVLFMIFWGILSVVWIKILYPRLSALFEKIPPHLRQDGELDDTSILPELTPWSDVYRSYERMEKQRSLRASRQMFPVPEKPRTPKKKKTA